MFLSDLWLLVTLLVFSNFWHLYHLTLSDLRLLITLLVSSNFWPLYHLSLSDLRLLIILLVSSNFWPLYHLSLSDLWLLNTLLMSSNFGPCITCPSLIYGFWLPLLEFWSFKLLTLVSPVPVWFTASDYPFWNFNLSNCWPLYHLSLSDLQLLITLLVSFKLLALVSPVPLWFTASDYPFGIFQTFGPCITCPSLIYTLSLLLWNLQTFGPCITCPSLIYTFSLPLLESSNFWPLNHLSLSDLHLVITSLESSNFWPLNHLSLSDLHLLITPFGIWIFKLLALVSSVPVWFTPSHYPLWNLNLQTFGPCIICPSLIYTFWLPLLEF